MLFDLKGRRKRFIQVTYVILAILFAIGLVGFGIGGATSGGLFDALGGGGGGSSGSSMYEKEAARAKKALLVNPKHERAWLKLAQAKINIARSGGDYDSNTGQFEEGATGDLKESARAWERYLKLKPKKPDALLANQMVQVYATLLRFDASSSPLDAFNQAARAQEIFAKARPSSIAYFNLATIQYQIGKIKRGDAAGDEAIRLTPKDQRNTVRAQIAEVRKEGVKLKRQQKKAEKQAAEAAKKASKSGKDPFGVPPTGPTTPGP
jgi:tetratricopeptide (TPR) repeat protein